MAEYSFSFEEVTNKGTVLLKGVVMPKEIRATLVDKTSDAGERLPTCSLTYRVREDYVKCVEVRFDAGNIGLPISAGVLRRIDPEEIGRNAIDYISRKRNDGQAITPRNISSKFAEGRKVTREELILVAEFFLNPANARGRIKAVQETLGYKTPLKAQRRISLAREMGLIPPPRSSFQEYSRAFAQLGRLIGEEFDDETE